MDKYSVKLLSAAYRNLDDIYAYIATQLHAEQSALNLADKPEEAIFSFPNSALATIQKRRIE